SSEFSREALDSTPKSRARLDASKLRGLAGTQRGQGFFRNLVEASRRDVPFELSIPSGRVIGREPVAESGQFLRRKLFDALFQHFHSTHATSLERLDYTVAVPSAFPFRARAARAWYSRWSRP